MRRTRHTRTDTRIIIISAWAERRGWSGRAGLELAPAGRGSRQVRAANGQSSDEPKCQLTIDARGPACEHARIAPHPVSMQIFRKNLISTARARARARHTRVSVLCIVGRCALFCLECAVSITIDRTISANTPLRRRPCQPDGIIAYYPKFARLFGHSGDGARTAHNMPGAARRYCSSERVRAAAVRVETVRSAQGCRQEYSDRGDMHFEFS